MLVRTLSFNVRLEKKSELIQKAQSELVPLVRQSGSPAEMLILQDDREPDRVLILTFWKSRNALLNYEEKAYPKVKALLESYSTLPPTSRLYRMDESFPVDLFGAAARKLGEPA